MKFYTGIKAIQAEPMTRGDYNKYRGWQIPENENPADEGYLVRYSDSYESWSPKDVFEEAYHESGNLSFSEALYLARHFGAKIARLGWNGKKQYITVATHFEYDDSTGHNKAEHKTSHSAALVFHGTLGDQVGWLASQSDMLSDDWAVVHNTSKAIN